MLDSYIVTLDLSNITPWVDPSEYQMTEIGFHHPESDGPASDPRSRRIER